MLAHGQVKPTLGAVTTRLRLKDRAGIIMSHLPISTITLIRIKLLKLWGIMMRPLKLCRIIMSQWRGSGNFENLKPRRFWEAIFSRIFTSNLPKFSVDLSHLPPLKPPDQLRNQPKNLPQPGADHRKTASLPPTTTNLTKPAPGPIPAKTLTITSLLPTLCTSTTRILTTN